jgi:tetratricopeptide (TPR) repeat protein
MLRSDPGAAATLERALRLSEVLALTDTFVQALTSRAMVLLDEGRMLEARLLLEGALARSQAGNLGWWRAANNLSMVLQHSDELHQALAVSEDIAAQAQQRGDLERLVMQRATSIVLLVTLGRWQEALERADETPVFHASDYARAERVLVIPVLCERGAHDAAEAILGEHEWERHAEHKEVAAAFATVEARLLRARGRLPEAVAAAERGFTYLSTSSLSNGYVRRALVQLLEASVPAGDLERVDELLAMVDGLQPGELTPSLRAYAARFRARVDALRGNLASVDRNFGLAEAGFSGLGFEFDLAVVRLEHAESLVARSLDDQAEPLLADARAAFERLEATPWLQRLAASARVEIPVA